MTRSAVTAALASALALSACVGGAAPPPPRVGEVSQPYRPTPRPPVRQPTPTVPVAPVPVVAATPGATAAQTVLSAAPQAATVPIDRGNAARALAAFRTSCPSLMRRTDTSGLTRGADWQLACAAAATTRDADAAAFFRTNFEAVQVGDGRGFATGYYVPEIAGSRERRAGYETPIYARPSDLVDVDLGLFADTLKGRKIRGRVQGTNFVPYYDRTAIEEGALADRARVLAWAADPVELFFLQVQGSGLVRLTDGSVLRIGYDTQNGRDYTGIGALMKSRGLLAPGSANMQGIVAWLHAHPDEGRTIMRENKSFVFFRELSGPPLGALGLPVSDGTTIAADVKFVPLGAPVLLSMDRADANGIWIAQDTGGAIKGPNRFDTFWGAGDEAEAIAGGMSARGTAFLLLPIGTLARVQVQAGGAQPLP